MYKKMRAILLEVLGFHHSTISRELKRCNNGYSALEANIYKDDKSSLKGRETKIRNDIKESLMLELLSEKGQKVKKRLEFSP